MMRKDWAAPNESQPGQNAKPRRKLRRALNALAAATALLACVVVATGQTAQQRVVLVRNVLIADEAGGPPVKTEALVVAARVTRVRDGVPVPAGALVIEGGGCLLTLAADGSINLKPLAEVAAAATPVAAAAGTAPQAAAQAPEENLSSKVVDPTAPLKTVTFQNKFSPSLWGIDDEQNNIETQVAFPYKFMGHGNIMRITIPYNTSLPFDGKGLGDVGVFSIMLFPKKWGTLAVGPVASLGVNKGPGVDTFAIGPAVGAVLKHKKLTYGIFSQNLFSAESTATSQIQPILAYTFNQKLSLAFGDQQFTYDWHKDRFVLAPVGFQLNYITFIGKQPVRFLIGPQYNFKNEFGSRKWTITTGFALILP